MNDTTPASQTDLERQLLSEIEVQNETLRVSADSLIVSRRALWASAAINVILATTTFVSTILTYSLSVSTEDLRKSSRRQLRAYIIFKDVEISTVMQSDMSGLATMKDVGQTPAYESINYSRFYFVSPENGSIKPTVAYETTCDRISRGEENFGGQKSYTLSLGRTSGMTPYQDITNFDEEDLLKFSTGSKALIIQGIACYKDIFEEPHYLKFCRYFSSVEAVKNKIISTCPTENGYDKSP